MSEPACLQISHAAWVFGFEIPYLPDVADDYDRLANDDLLSGYHSLAEALAMSPAGSSAVQIRLIGAGSSDGAPIAVRAVLLGRARTEEALRALLELVSASLPTELPRQAITDPATLRSVLVNEPAQVVEVTRRVEDVGALPDAALQRTPDLPAILRWAPTDFGLRQAAALLARQPNPAQIVLHMEPARPSAELMDHLDTVIREAVIDLDAASNPLRLTVARQYRERLRDLPRAALQVRVLVTSSATIPAGLLAGVGIALTEQGGYETRPAADDRQLIEWRTILRELLAPRVDLLDPLVQLRNLADTDEAARLVRFPLPVRGGSLGLRSSPVPALPRAAEPAVPAGQRSVRIGWAAGGGEVHLTHQELNQHVVVAGLPGFGKTITTQTILAQLWRDHIPFLVLDPAKSDYRGLARELGDELRVYRLTPREHAFNPFGVPVGCEPTTHAGRVLAAFDAAFRLSSEWPAGYVTLARGIYAAYEAEPTPTLESVRRHLDEVISTSRFTGPDGTNLRASLLGRIDFLARGPLGVALSAPAEGGVDHELLTSQPSVIELRGFAGPMERSLIFGLLLSGLISYRENNPLPGQLGHVTVLEEAHRLLRRPTWGSEPEGVRLFVEAIAELRGSGEGFMVVDQAPTLLDPGVMKLAGSVCTHRLVDPDERATVGAALLLDERQSLDLARLRPGELALHSSSRTSSTLTRVDPPPALLSAEQPAVDDVAQLPWQAEPELLDDEELLRRVRELAGKPGVTGEPSPFELMARVVTDLVARRADPVTVRRQLAQVSDVLMQTQNVSKNNAGSNS